MTTKEFFDVYGHRLVTVNYDDAETGDFRLMFPEEQERAIQYQQEGYTIASIFEVDDYTEVVEIDNYTGNAFHKVGMYVIDLRL